MFMPKEEQHIEIGGRRNVPQIGELVIATISKIMPYGAYCRLPEYENLEVFLPIKEISSGWIKNIHEFVHDGQKVVCKVTFYDKERQTIDVSLKKVTPKDTKSKLSAYNLEKRLNSMFIQAIKSSGLDPQKDELTKKALEEFQTFTNLVRTASEDEATFQNSKLPKKLKDGIVRLLKVSQKKKRYIVSYIMKLSTTNTMSGASELRDVLGEIKNQGIDVKYISAPKYRLVAEGKDYSEAEGKIKSVADIAASKLKKGTFEVEKEKLRKEKEDIMASL
jgi:translation initiation factor 2 subunit 1